MKNLLLFSSMIVMAGCTAHIGGRDLVSAFQSSQYSRAHSANQPSRAECRAYAVQAAADNAEAEYKSAEYQLSSTQKALAENRAWQNGQCVKPAMRSIPDKPKGLTSQEVEFQAVGSCVDTLSRRLPITDVVQALSAYRREHYLVMGDQWAKGSKESCANHQSSMADIWVIRAFCGMVGQEGKWACFNDHLDKCVIAISQNCNAPLTYWQQTVSQIKGEPEQLYMQCQQQLNTINHLEQTIPRLQITAQLNREERQSLPEKTGNRFACQKAGHL